MSNERHVPTPDPATNVSCLPMTPLLKPFAGDATVEVTIDRDTSYTGPYTVQIRRQGATIASTTVAAPDVQETISLNVPATQLTGCELKLEACVASTIEVSCCPYPIPATLKAKFQVKRDGSTIASPEVNLDYFTSMPEDARYGGGAFPGYYGTTLLDIPCLLENVQLQIYLFCDGDEFLYGIMTVHGDDNGEMNGPGPIPIVGCSPLYLEELSTLSYTVYCYEVTSNLSIVNFHITE
ncbi:hypothetical protein [Planctopirus hydrillae]|uniref:Uncharacterized protein n=1 Tax=Planctopirus hydrillae TaxID=1841610 RepID=A0A1C3EIP5_9PLAN|nr:hypothetical protein [Planctopirus hydrillae]ODA33116.1 hypothetical protein A6X21_04960 [Planctopirus hydrillae]